MVGASKTTTQYVNFCLKYLAEHIRFNDIEDLSEKNLINIIKESEILDNKLPLQRKPTSYNLYVKDKRLEGYDMKEISKMWKKEKDSVKDEYKEKSNNITINPIVSKPSKSSKSLKSSKSSKKSNKTKKKQSKPLNGWIVFCNEQKKQGKEMSEIKEMWGAFSVQEKEEYKQKGKELFDNMKDNISDTEDSSDSD